MKFILLIIIFFINSCGDKAAVKTEVELQQNQLSYIIYDLEKGQIKASLNPNKILIPASLFKLFTAYAVLDSFAYDSKFSTKIYYSGQIDQGILYGDLIIVGGGDPNLQYKDLYNIASLIKQKNISKIKGDLYYYEGDFLQQSYINKQQPDAKYNPGFSSLLLNNNHFLLKKNNNKIISVPDLDYMKFETTNNLTHSQYLEDNNWLLGKYNKYYLPVKNSSYFTSQNFYKILKYNGIEVRWGGKIDKLPKVIELLSYNSDELIDIVHENLLYSNNLTSEILLLHFAKQQNCSHNNLNEAAKCLNNWYNKKFPNQEWQGLFWENASGLSVKTRVTTLHILLILKEIYHKQYGNNNMVSLLPIAGISGTLAKKFQNNSLQIWAKTGNMNFISGLAGFLFKDNSRYAFVILANDQINRDKLDYLAKIGGFTKPYNMLLREAKLWKKSVYKMQQEIIAKWLIEDNLQLSRQ